MGPAGSFDPAGDDGEITRCSLRGSAQLWVQPAWDTWPQRRDTLLTDHSGPQGARDMPAITDDVEVRQGTYGEKVIAVEPGGAEFIPLSERHGRPLQLFWTWTSPNMEFATVFVGFLGVAYFGMGFWSCFSAVVLGNLLGSITQGILSTSGPQYGVPQMVISRRGFGYWGNALPAGINAVVAGIGWFAVNSVSGTLALNSLTHMPRGLCPL